MFRLKQNDFFDSNKIINVLPRLPQEPFPEHCHTFHELVVVKSGCAIHVCDGRAVHISRGSVLYLREDDVHFFDQMNNLCLTNILFKPDELHSSTPLRGLLTDGFQTQLKHLLLNSKSQQQAEQLMHQIAQENEKKDEYSAVMVECLFSQLAVTLWRANRDRKMLGNAADEYDNMLSLINYLNENHQEDINWNEVSEKFKIPLRTLNRKLQEYTGLTPNNYLGRIRLCQATHLLSHTQNSVTDIAFDCGFNDGNYFSSKFNHAFNMTPLQYRKRYRQTSLGGQLLS